MKINILKEKENPFLERKELELQIIHTNEPTPSKNELIKKIGEMFSVKETHIKIDYIFSRKGLQEAFAKVKIYKKPIPQEVKEEKPEKKEEAKEPEKKEEEKKVEETKKPEEKEGEKGETQISESK